jgi:hypothetical protein
MTKTNPVSQRANLSKNTDLSVIFQEGHFFIEKILDYLLLLVGDRLRRQIKL